MEVERATLDDCRAIAEVHVESWQHAYRGIMPAPYLASLSVAEREAMWRRMLDVHPASLLVVHAAKQMIGFVSFGASRDDDAPADRAEIWALYVKPSYWSSGAGRLLLQAVLRQIRVQGYSSVSLWVVVGNERAIRFYERAGFVAESESVKQFERGGAQLEEVRYVLRAAG